MTTQRRSTCALVLLLAPLSGFFAGCFAPEANPLAALSAVGKIEGAVAAIEQGADPFDAIQAAVKDLTASELASAANLYGGLGLSLAEAQDILDLVGAIDGQVLAELQAAGIDITDPATSVEEIVNALHAAGLADVTAEQVEVFLRLAPLFRS